MRLTVDPELCQGHALCAAAAPALVVLDDEDGHASAVPGDVPADQVSAARRAVTGCPEQAVGLLDSTTPETKSGNNPENTEES